MGLVNKLVIDVDGVVLDIYSPLKGYGIEPSSIKTWGMEELGSSVRAKVLALYNDYDYMSALKPFSNIKESVSVLNALHHNCGYSIVFNTAVMNEGLVDMRHLQVISVVETFQQELGLEFPFDVIVTPVTSGEKPKFENVVVFDDHYKNFGQCSNSVNYLIHTHHNQGYRDDCDGWVSAPTLLHALKDVVKNHCKCGG